MVNNRDGDDGEAPETPRLIEDCLSPLPSSPSKKTSSAKRKQYYINRAIRNSDLTPKAKGRKSLRRLENNRYLTSLLEREECVPDEVDSCLCASPSIFAEVCNNELYIEIWNDFMNRSGEEQEKVLAYLEQQVRKPREKGNKCTDERTAHPVQAEQCYQRINRSLRCTLRRRQIPMGTLEVLEEEMLSFFSVTPESVYTAMMENRLQLERQTSDASDEQEPRVLPPGVALVLLPPDEVLTAARPCRILQHNVCGGRVVGVALLRAITPLGPHFLFPASLCFYIWSSDRARCSSSVMFVAEQQATHGRRCV